MSDINVFESHSLKQQQAILSEKQILLVGAGTQWGKTQVGALRMKRKIHQFTEKTDNFLITSPTYKTLHQSTMPAFLKYMEGCGIYDNKFDVFKIHGGGQVYCRTERDPDSIIGITNIKHVWGDEAGKYGLYFWENMQARADFCGCGIDLTTSPYSLNWVYKDIIKPFRAGKRPDVDYIKAASWENPYHSLHNEDKRLLKQSTMDPRRFNSIYGGAFEKMEGLVYDCYQEDKHTIEPIALPSDTVYYAGIDWGFTDPFVMTVFGVTPGGHMFLVSEFYKTQLTINDILVVAKQKQKIFNIKTFYAGPDQPGYIEEFNRNRLTCLKANNDIRVGVDRVYELIKTHKFHVFKGVAPYFNDEVEMYHYPEPEDLGPDDKTKDQLPVGAGDHVMDSVRYCIMMTYRSANRNEPKTPSEIHNPRLERDHEKRIELLRKPKKHMRGTEEFS